MKKILVIGLSLVLLCLCFAGCVEERHPLKDVYVEENESTTTAIDSVSTTTASEDVMVFIPQSGSKYHSRAGCSNMKDPDQVTKSRAEELGYTPCKKCY